MAVDIFKFGLVELFILLFLRQEDAHGYQLVQKIEELSGGLLTVKTASLYPVLYKLAEAGCVTGKEEIVEHRSARNGRISSRVRIVYHLEEAGHKRLEELLASYESFIKGCDNVFVNVEGGKEHD